MGYRLDFQCSFFDSVYSLIQHSTGSLTKPLCEQHKETEGFPEPAMHVSHNTKSSGHGHKREMNEGLPGKRPVNNHLIITEKHFLT